MLSIVEGDWFGKPANIKLKVENNGAVVYVGSSLTVHSPGDSPYCCLFTNCDWIN